MRRDPLTRQRSPWEPVVGAVLPTPTCQVWERRTGDGRLLAVLDQEPHGWHLSVSFTDHRGRHSRYPRWDELADARDELLPADMAFVMHLPRTDGDAYVAVHPTTMHLFEHPARNQP